LDAIPWVVVLGLLLLGARHEAKRRKPPSSKPRDPDLEVVIGPDGKIKSRREVPPGEYRPYDDDFI